MDRQTAIANASRVFSLGRDLRDSLSPRRAAEEAAYAGGESVDVIEHDIRAARVVRRPKKAA